MSDISNPALQQLSACALLDETVCDEMYEALNETNVFHYDEQLRDKHLQVCAMLDRLRHATAWINSHQETPRGDTAPTMLMVFMMFASLVKDSIERLRKSFGLSATIFDEGHPDSRRFFAKVCQEPPLSIPSTDCPTDDEFFQYFRSLVFAHSAMVTMAQRILFQNEVQYCPYILKWVTKNKTADTDDCVGVMVYSTVEKRNGKELRIPFSTLKAYVKSRYESLRLVRGMIVRKISEAEKAWRTIKVDKSLSPLDQLKFMMNELETRCETAICYDLQILIDSLDAPCSIEKNHACVELFRHEIIQSVPHLVDYFETPNYECFVREIENFTNAQLDGRERINYILRKIFENLGNAEMRNCAVLDIETVSKAFAGRWVVIDPSMMPDNEIEMLIRAACFFQKKECSNT